MAEATPRMDTIQFPGPLPATVTRSRPLIEAVMAQSVREQGPDSRTAQAWRWVLTGQGPSPVSRALGIGTRPSADDIVAEARTTLRRRSAAGRRGKVPATVTPTGSRPAACCAG
jgi:hypothetical protein